MMPILVRLTANKEATNERPVRNMPVSRNRSSRFGTPRRVEVIDESGMAGRTHGWRRLELISSKLTVEGRRTFSEAAKGQLADFENTAHLGLNCSSPVDDKI
jgi:hypothetical protein